MDVKWWNVWDKVSAEYNSEHGLIDVNQEFTKYGIPLPILAFIWLWDNMASNYI